MPLLFERENPRDMAEGATAASRLHDVVVSASKVIHGRNLDADDLAVLGWAKEMLQATVATHAVATVPSASELSGPSDPIVVLRKMAADPSQVSEWGKTLRELSEAIEAVIKGQRSESLTKALESVRAIFMMVSKAILGAEVVTRADNSFGASWLHSTTNSTL